MKHPDEEIISKIHADSSLTVVENFTKIRRRIKEGSSVDLLEKSPETLALLCVAAGIYFHAGMVRKNSGSQSFIDPSDVSQLCSSIDRLGGDVLGGCTRIAKAIEEQTGAIERKNDE